MNSTSKIFKNCQILLSICLVIFLINTANAQSANEYPKPQQDLSQANVNAQIPANVKNLAKDVGPWKKFVKWYRIYDPLYDTWEMEEADLGNNRYFVQLKTKHFVRGGDGEALQIFKRRAEQSRMDKKMGYFEILEFNEGIENEVMHTRRFANGIFELKPDIAFQNADDPSIYFPPPPVKKGSKNASKSNPPAKNKNKNINKKSTKKVKPKTNKKVKTKKAKTCDCCDMCNNNNNNNTKNNNKDTKKVTPSMDADSWKLNGEARI